MTKDSWVMSLYQASFRIQIKDNIECDKPVSSWPNSGVECPSTSKTKPIIPWSIQYCSPQRHHIKCDHTERLTEEWLLIWKERIASTDINGKLIEVRDRMVACHMKRQSSIYHAKRLFLSTTTIPHCSSHCYHHVCHCHHYGHRQWQWRQR